MWITPNLVAATAILLLKAIATEAGCYWNGEGCAMYCTTSNTVNVIGEVEQKWNEREECHSDGVSLRLRPLAYPNDTIGSNWFTANMTVAQLDVHLDYVVSVSADAFNADAFRTVKKLSFENFGLSLMVNGTFNGLEQLETINIKSANGVNKIEKGVLDKLTELREFTFEQTGKSSELNINGLTGSENLLNLEYVKFYYNLTNSIKRSTFIGLTNVKRLDLSSCQIKSIEDNAFDPISGTIEHLDLSGNALTTLSYGVFSMVLPNIMTIKMDGNSWHCDCDLLPFRLFIEQYKENFNEFNCTSPTECRISNILESDCFDDCELPSTTTSITTTTTAITTSTTNFTTPPDTNIMIECYSERALADTVSVKRPIGYMTISENENGEVNLNIDNVKSTASLVIIWFDEKQNSGDISEDVRCISKSEITSIPMNDLEYDTTYSFCLMDETSTSVSPLDCISYAKRHDQIKAVWLFESSKALIVTLIVISLVLSVFVGIVIGFWILKYNPFSKYDHQITKDSHDFDEINEKDRVSNIYTKNTNSTTTTDQQDTFECPPLPERPRTLFEEPVYASVEDT